MGLFSQRSLADGNDNPQKGVQWEKVWEEDFNKNQLDTTVWGYMKRWKDESRKYHSDFNECYEFRNGKLVVKGIRNHSANDTAKYLTGGVTTNNKKSFAPGKIEVRAKIKNVQGAWPAIWMLPYAPKKKWPASGEIDIMEHVSNNDFVSQGVHTAYTKKNPKRRPINFADPKIKQNEFNTYAVEIHEDCLIFYVNDKQTLIYPKEVSFGAEEQFPFYQDWYLMLDMQMGAPWIEKIADDQLPAEMEIDWVRYYIKINK